MSAPRFKAGEVVVLKSGSKPLTVTDTDGKEVKLCWWDDHKQKICTNSIHQDALRATEDLNAANGKTSMPLT
jgi:uncharacterized protein YodC (DUF2158 family)